MAFPYLGDFYGWTIGMELYLPIHMFGLIIVLVFYSAVWLLKKNILAQYSLEASFSKQQDHSIEGKR